MSKLNKIISSSAIAAGANIGRKTTVRGGNVLLQKFVKLDFSASLAEHKTASIAMIA